MSILKKILIVLVFGVVVLMISGYYAIFHTSLPAKAIVGVINQSPDVDIRGLDGSFSSGFSVESILLTDDNGNTNSLDDIKLYYESGNESITITEFHVDKGHFYIDSSKITSTSGEIDEEASNTGENSMGLYIQKMSITNITIEDIYTGEQFKLDGLQVQDLKFGDSAHLGKLLLESDNCNIKIAPVKNSDPQTYTFDATLKQALHKKILKDISLQGQTYRKNNNTKFKFSAFEGKVKLSEERLKISDFNLNQYFLGAPPIYNLNLDIKANEGFGNAQGSFLIGNALFNINPTIKISDKSYQYVIAECESDKGIFKIFIQSEAENNFVNLKIESSPAMSTEDILATLVYSKKSKELEKVEKQELNKLLKYFMSPLRKDLAGSIGF